MKEKKELTVIESLIVHSKLVIALKWALNQARTADFILNLLPVVIVSDRQSLMEEIRSKIKEEQKSMKFLLRNILDEKDFELQDGIYASFTNLESGFIFLNKTIERDENEKPVKTSPFILFLQDYKEIKEGDILPYHACKDIIGHLPSLDIDKVGIKLSLYKNILRYKCSKI